MLEMMPGSLIDKTNNNLSNIACLHSNIAKNINQEKDYIMDFTHNSDISLVSTEVIHSASDGTVRTNIPENNTEVLNSVSGGSVESSIPKTNTSILQTTDISSTKRKENYTEKKILQILEKYNISEEELYRKLSKCKRKNRDKRKQNRVLSYKVKRYYFKRKILKWSNRLVSVKHIKSTQIKSKSCFNTINSNENLVNVPETLNDHTKGTENEQLSEVNKSNILLPIIPNFKADDDIRNKIKQQLELLRTNRKVSTKNTDEDEADEENNDPEMSENNNKELKISDNNTDSSSSLETPTTVTSTDTQTVPSVEADLSEVILAKGVMLSIVSVVGGYVSDEEMGEESTKADGKMLEESSKERAEIGEETVKERAEIRKKSPNERAEIRKESVNEDTEISGISSKEDSEIGDTENNNENANNYTSPIGKGTSITDILLKRDFYVNEDDSHLISPKKTNDITKIKGWRGKQFTLTISPVKNVTDEESATEEVEANPEESAVVYPIREMLSRNSLEDPVPSTSSGCSGSDSFKPTINPNSHVLPGAGNILKQGEGATSEQNSKSAFVSDVLDTFLSNHSELKISYEVPKLVAEGAISKPASEMPVTTQEYLVIDQSKTNSKLKYQKKNALKPKTLAEKRRMLEIDRKNQLLHDMAVNETLYLKRLEYCEKRNRYDIAKDVRDGLISDQIPFSRYCWNMATRSDEEAKQFAVVNGTKIRINGSCGGRDLQISDLYRKTSDICDNEILGDVSKSTGGCMLNRFSKPSLLGTEQRNSNLKRPVQYKPGPLSKKRKLLKNLHTKENWECQVLKMPKIKLVLYPEQGKRIPALAEKYLQLCRCEKGLISDEWAKFAVSAVRCEENLTTQVEFELPYANRQNKLLVRKRVYTDSTCETSAPVRNSIKFPDINVEDTIKDIMTDMLDFIDSQEIDRVIIKQDPDLKARYQINMNEDNCRPPSPINSMVKAIIKRPNAKKSKTTLELRRLNVQVIEVDVKEEETDNKVCTNDFCRLGCVCKSLRGSTAIVPQHCGREECMLACTCTFESAQRARHSITLPPGTDLLSASTVVRLQDEVKRNLAKEERKFTQTVIKANNQTIMVGGGARERQRRVSKVPKKYSNYVQKSNKSLSYMEMISNGLLEDEQDPEFTVNKYQLNKTQSPPKVPTEIVPGIIELKKTIPIWIKDEDDKSDVNMQRVCRVRLENLQLENVTPWCMIHNLYKCHCGGKAVLESHKVTQVIKSKNEEERVDKTIMETIPAAKEFIPYQSRFSGRYQPESVPSTTVPEVMEKYCARTRVMGTKFSQARNKSQNAKARGTKIKPHEVKNDDKSVYTVRANRKQIYKQQKVKVSDILDNVNSDSGEPDLVITKPKKQITIVDVDEILNSKSDTAQIQEYNSETIDKPCHIITSPSFIDYDRSYMGLLIPSEDWIKRFQGMMKFNENQKFQIRFLEWATLVKRQKNGSIQMWFKNNKYNNILLTEDRRRPSRNHMNIKLFENTPLHKFKVPELITSVLSNKLPGKAKKATDTYVILVHDGITWEARGTILIRIIPELYRTRLSHTPTPVTILNPYLEHPKKIKRTYSILKPIDKVSDVNNQPLLIRSTPSMSVEVVNNPLPSTSSIASQSNIKGIEITKVIVDDKTELTSTTIEKKKPAAILAPLPTIFKSTRWFALVLENDFSVLRISQSNFHIKYTHLNTAIQMARNNQRTVRIRAQDTDLPDEPGNIGIYALEEHNDRIFFGPYGNGRGHGLETFRYVNSKLVNTTIYNKMRGTTARKTGGIWYSHTSTIHSCLYLEPETDDLHSSSSECYTEMTSVENAVKPQIEFVDLTGNDSDNEDSQVDPMFNVLSADFSKKITADVTIEPVRLKKNNNVSVTTNANNSKKTDLVIEQVTDNKTNRDVLLEIKRTSENLNRAERKRKSTSVLPQEPPRQQPKIIDSINLDQDDDDMPSIEPFYKQAINSTANSPNNSRVMPKLQPINEHPRVEAWTNNDSSKSDNISYVITNIPGVGYFEIARYSTKYQVLLNIEIKRTPTFLSIKNAISWLELLFHKNIYFLPVNLTIQFSNLKSTDVPAMPKFNENYLNGFHMVCEKGIFDLLHMSTSAMENLGFSESESAKLLAHKCELLIKRDIKLLGRMLFSPEESSKMDRNQILRLAPTKIKTIQSREGALLREKKKLWDIQQQLLYKINTRITGVPAAVKNTVKQNIITLFNKIPTVKLTDSFSSGNTEMRRTQATNIADKMYKLPVGKVCKIVDGKVMVADKPIVSLTKDLSIIKAAVSNKQTTPYPVKLITTGAVQSYPSTTKTDKFEMLVPIAGLETPVTVVGVPPNLQNKPSASSLLFTNKTKSPKVVDLTDD